MIGFFNPLAWIGLLTLAIPVIIHLWRKQKAKHIKVGSIQFIEAVVPRQQKHLQIKNWPLFIVRCLLFASLVLILVAPFWETEPNPPAEKWILHDPASLTIPLTESQQNFVDSLELAGFSHRYLAFDVPDLSQNPNQIKRTPAWSILRSLNNKISAESEITLLAEASKFHLSGIRPGVSFKVDWINQTAESIEKQIASWPISADSSFLLTELRSRFKTTFLPAVVRSNSESNNSINNQVPELTQVVLIADDHQEAKTNFLSIAITVVSEATYQNIEIETASPAEIDTDPAFCNADFIFSLENTSSKCNNGTNVILIDAKTLEIQNAASLLSFLLEKLAPEIETSFVTVPIAQVLPAISASLPDYPTEKKPLTDWLFFLPAGLFLIERIMASRA